MEVEGQAGLAAQPELAAGVAPEEPAAHSWPQQGHAAVMVPGLGLQQATVLLVRVLMLLLVRLLVWLQQPRAAVRVPSLLLPRVTVLLELVR